MQNDSQLYIKQRYILDNIVHNDLLSFHKIVMLLFLKIEIATKNTLLNKFKAVYFFLKHCVVCVQIARCPVRNSTFCYMCSLQYKIAYALIRVLVNYMELKQVRHNIYVCFRVCIYACKHIYICIYVCKSTTTYIPSSPFFPASCS